MSTSLVLLLSNGSADLFIGRCVLLGLSEKHQSVDMDCHQAGCIKNVLAKCAEDACFICTVFRGSRSKGKSREAQKEQLSIYGNKGERSCSYYWWKVASMMAMLTTSAGHALISLHQDTADLNLSNEDFDKSKPSYPSLKARRFQGSQIIIQPSLLPPH